MRFKTRKKVPQRLGSASVHVHKEKNSSSKMNSIELMQISIIITLIVSVVMLMIQMHVLENHVIDTPLSLIHEALSPSEPIGLRNTTTTTSSSTSNRTKDKCDNIDDDDDIDSDLKPILKILCRGGYDVSQNSKMVDRSLLPKWSEILEFYGPPKILGLETCQAYRNKIRPDKRFMAPAGMFNTGTNLLNSMLIKNCDFSRIGVTDKMRCQVPWGKHTPFRFHVNHTAFHGDKSIVYYESMPVVAVRDPYTWLKSMCRQPYAAKYAHGNSTCPNIVPYPSDIKMHPRFKNMKYIPVHLKYSRDEGMSMRYESMAHLWNEWYTEYIEFDKNDDPKHAGTTTTMKTPDFPFVVLRMEDLVFHAETVMPQICECGGGTLKGDVIKQTAVMANGGNRVDTSGGRMSGLLRSVVNYGNITKRRDGYPKFQLEAAKDTLDSRLMNLLGYPYEKP